MKKLSPIICLAVLAPFIFYATPSFALTQARILSDHELDQIHAGGLNFDFGKLLGSYSTTTDTVSKGGVSDSSANNQVFEAANGKVKVFSIPRTPKTPTAPKKPDLNNLKNLTASIDMDAAAALPESNLADTGIPEQSLTIESTAAASLTQEPVNDMAVSSIQDTASLAQPVSSVEAAPAPPNSTPVSPELNLQDSGAITQQLADNTLNTTAQNTLTHDGQGPASNTVSPGALDAGQTGIKAEPAQQPLASSVVEPGQTIANNTAVNNALPDDLAVIVDTPTGGQMGVIIDGNALSSLQNGTGTANILNVTDTAQQYLQSLANINAVNSTVPVQINMVVMIDSVVENLNNSNTLSIDASSVFNLQ